MSRLNYDAQAAKILEQSGLVSLQQAKRIIQFFRTQYLHAFFYAPAWLEKYLKGIARILVEESNGDKEKFLALISDARNVFESYLIWVVGNRELVGAQIDDNFVNHMSYEALQAEVKRIQIELDNFSNQRLSTMHFTTSDYTLVPISSYQNFHNLYGENQTGDETDYPGQTFDTDGNAWCHVNSEHWYDFWLYPNNFLFVLQQNNWKQIHFNPTTNKEQQGKDEYGLSLIAFITDEYGRLQYVTLRCNHVGLNKCVDNQFYTYAELSEIAGFNVQIQVKNVISYLKQTRNHNNCSKVY